VEAQRQVAWLAIATCLFSCFFDSAPHADHADLKMYIWIHRAVMSNKYRYAPHGRLSWTWQRVKHGTCYS
jgi:hypothetical protein